MSLAQLKIKLPIGSFYILADKKGLCEIRKKKHQTAHIVSIKNEHSKEAGLKESRKHLRLAEKQLIEYFNGTRTTFSISLNPHGTEFQKKVWQALLKIPYGQTVSYQQLASNIQNPKACRAVGNANGKNPLCIVIPCHRVIAANKKLGGYSGGLEMKKNLLRIEGHSKF